jgi:hypothetical protein
MLFFVFSKGFISVDKTSIETFLSIRYKALKKYKHTKKIYMEKRKCIGDLYIDNSLKLPNCSTRLMPTFL